MALKISQSGIRKTSQEPLAKSSYNLSVIT